VQEQAGSARVTLELHDYSTTGRLFVDSREGWISTTVTGSGATLDRLSLSEHGALAVFRALSQTPA
jgi:hypothetical protein